MDKRVESLQADCLDGGSTPPSSTKKERTSVLFFCGAGELLTTYTLIEFTTPKYRAKAKSYII